MKCEKKCGYASYNFPGVIPAAFCEKCKKDGMIKRPARYCKCGRMAIYNYQNPARYCSDCKKPDMLHLVGKKCIECKKVVPSFNFEGLAAKYCDKCKKPGMDNVNKKTCVIKGCTTTATFNFEKETTPLYCGKHKTDDMKMTYEKYCIECKVISASFNFEGEKYGLYCFDHRKPGMISVVNPKCVEPGCKITPSFGFENGKKEYCGTHALKGMINLSHRNDTCEKCDTRPSYGYTSDRKRIRCSKHKTNDMMYLVCEMCIECEKVVPVFNYPNEKYGEYCFTCKKDDMINVITPRCLTPMCDKQIFNKKYDGYCVRCFMYMFPDKPITINYKTKERDVIQFVTNEFKELTWICDKRIEGGISRRRPDLYVNLGSHNLIIEIDENQHNEYDCICENKRIMELSLDVKHIPTIFIRFNPDGYKKGDEYIESCWTLNKNGLCSVKRGRRQEDWIKRLAILKCNIEYWIENKTDKIVEIIQLFYDS